MNFVELHSFGQLRMDYSDIVGLLIKTGKVNIDHEDLSGQTPLCLASACGQMNVVELLIETGEVNVDSRDKKGRTPLLHAAIDWT